MVITILTYKKELAEVMKHLVTFQEFFDKAQSTCRVAVVSLKI